MMRVLTKAADEVPITPSWALAHLDMRLLIFFHATVMLNNIPVVHPLATVSGRAKRAREPGVSYVKRPLFFLITTHHPAKKSEFMQMPVFHYLVHIRGA